MKNNRVGFGIVGLGQISKTHARALQDQEDCYLVGGFHKNPEKAEKWGRKPTKTDSVQCTLWKLLYILCNRIGIMSIVYM